VPLIGVYICASTQNIYAGLYYPMIIASSHSSSGSLLLAKRMAKIWSEVELRRRLPPAIDS